MDGLDVAFFFAVSEAELRTQLHSRRTKTVRLRQEHADSRLELPND